MIVLWVIEVTVVMVPRHCLSLGVRLFGVGRRTETSVWVNGVRGYATSFPKRFLRCLGLTDLTSCRLVWVMFQDGSISVRVRRPDGSTVQSKQMQ